MIAIWLSWAFSSESILLALAVGLTQWFLLGNEIAKPLLPMDAEEVEAWERIRAKGVYSYVVGPGIILPLGLMLWILSVMLMAGASTMAYEPVGLQLKMIGFYLLFILGVTCFFGCLRTLIWLHHQRRYKHSVKGARRQTV